MLTAKPLVDLARRASRSIFKTAFYSPHWRIGWRFVDESDDVWSRGDLGGHPWQVLRNKPFRFFADPFPVAWNAKRRTRSLPGIMSWIAYILLRISWGARAMSGNVLRRDRMAVRPPPQPPSARPRRRRE